MLQPEEKRKIIEKFGTSEKDTASPQVQIALISARLQYLGSHFSTHSKDHHSRRGLMKMVGKRKRLLNYLSTTNPKGHAKLIEELNIRK